MQADLFVPLALLVLLAWLPGALLHRVFHVARGPWGTGVVAVEASLSLAFLSLVLLPFYVACAPVGSAPLAAAAATAVLLMLAARRAWRAPREVVLDEGATAAEIACFVAAVAVLLPATLRFSGANVDDWWDLSFVSGWIADGRFSFAQMALSPDPGTHESAVHPRFLWSAWLMLQALVATVSGEQAWRVQAGPLAGSVCVLVVSAQMALARALFRHRSRRGQLVTATALMTAAWIWGTDALPLFVRGYQDKLVAAFVLAPVLIALVVDTASSRASADPDDRRRATIAVAAVAFATVSVHSLIYTMAVFVCVLAVLARLGQAALWWLRHHLGVAAALLVPALYPVAQALILATTFGEQGISLATRDNPVVRAHLSLNRLVADVSPGWIVHPGATFGPIALLAVVGIRIAWRWRHYDDSARMLIATTIVPAALLFVPGLAAIAGKIWVPWMLYRLGWMVPVAPVLAYAAVFLVVHARRRDWPVAAALFLASVVVLAWMAAGDRLRRDMHEHPEPPPGAPNAAARAVYDFLASRPGREAVLAPPNFSELVPAISGKPVVAFSERGTLVFSTGETRAYERLRDRATFFASDTSTEDRDRIADRYGVRWAVLPRTLAARSNERAWVTRFGPEALLAARTADAEVRARCEVGDRVCCRTWWSATGACVRDALSQTWQIVLETRDYFVVERKAGLPAQLEPATAPMEPADPAETKGARSVESPALPPPWLRPFSMTQPEAAPSGLDVLASAVGSPGAIVSYDIPPRFVLPSVQPIWLEGPSPWEDVPSDVTVTLDATVACRFAAVAVVPHLPHERRDVLEVSADGHVVRASAHHGVPIVVATNPSLSRSAVTVRIRSLIGSPVSLSDIRLLGDRTRCGAGWPKVLAPSTPQMEISSARLLSLAAALPESGRPFVSLATAAHRDRDGDADIELLQEAAVREPSLVEAWLDLGFAADREAGRASSRGAADEASKAATQLVQLARRSFGAAVRADSHNAWAQGCAAWSDRRAGHPLRAMWRAINAASLDPLYGDAWTIVAYALGDLRLTGLAERALAAAEDVDRDRNWPVLARADIAIAERYRKAADAPAAIERARDSLRSWIRQHPFDQAARDKLSQLGAPDDSSEQGGEAAP